MYNNNSKSKNRNSRIRNQEAPFKSIREIPLPELEEELEVVAASVTTSQDRKKKKF